MSAIRSTMRLNKRVSRLSTTTLSSSPALSSTTTVAFVRTRHLHASTPCAKAGKDERLSQGSAAADKDNSHPQDPHSQAARSGKEQGGSDAPLDAASAKQGGQAQKTGTKAGERDADVGMVEQVGSASASADDFGKGGKKGKEEPAASDYV
ncbi:hypothetical protein BD626DRAFT_581415 [Schizophyllum amplum]|uniref:Uncharacterized protein n=1 Tax=Schizophyllum amplum TaxID=97359 RepID=A0A550CVC9_9AGAR|nr:hypothetical protein BD626DRAFT_581415 [Auriculariopsis ampla]